MQPDPYAAIAKPIVDDPYAAIAKPIAAAAPSPSSSTAMTRLFGEHPLSDAASVVGTHLTNMIAGPYHAFADAPRDAREAAEKGTGPDSGHIANVLGQFGLGAARMLVNPTVDALKAVPTSANATDVMNHLTDAIPIVGPWARNIENDAQAHGAIPALLGLGTDIAAPKVAGIGVTGAARAAGLGTAVASATDASRNLAASRILLKGSPGELLQSALKPGIKYGANVGESLEKALPSVIAANPGFEGVSGFANAADAAKEAAFVPYKNLTAPYRPIPGGIGPVRPSAIHGNPIADAQLGSIPTMDLLEKPTVVSPGGMSAKSGIFGKTADVADNYRRNLSVPLLDDIRGDANGKLNAFYNKAGGDRAAALSNPETARVKAVGDATRDVLYPQLEKDAGLPAGSVDAMQQKYGLLADTADIANKRDPVFARHDPVSLSTKIVSGHGNPISAAWNYFLQSKLGDLTNSDAQVNSAVDRFQNPIKTPLVPRPGLASKIALPIGKTLLKTPMIPLLGNPLFLGKDYKP